MSSSLGREIELVARPGCKSHRSTALSTVLSKGNCCVVRICGAAALGLWPFYYVLYLVLPPFAILYHLLCCRRRLLRDTVRLTIFQALPCCCRGSLTPLPRCVTTEHPRDVRDLSDSRTVRFVVLSDTHGAHRSLGRVPGGDVVVHCGDCTDKGTVAELLDFADWFGSLPHRHKVLVPGNHDLVLDSNFYAHRWHDWSSSMESAGAAWGALGVHGVHVLIGDLLVLRGLRIYGSPFCPSSCLATMAFDRTENQLKRHWQRIPEAVDLLVTHAPPATIRDHSGVFATSQGCPMLRKEVQERVRPAFHVFGHTHAGYGAVLLGETCFINAAMMTSMHAIAGRVPLCFSLEARD